jgi:hypothetical protein
MANLTVTIDAGILARARARALERGTSVNAVVREHLEAYAGESPAARAIAEYLELADRAIVARGVAVGDPAGERDADLR